MASADTRTDDSKKVTKTTESSTRNTDATTLPLYIQLLALEDGGGVITNAEPFDCVICLTTINTDDGVRLRNCLHQFCRDCLNRTIIHCEEADVACPFGDGSTRCESVLQDREIRGILTKNEFDQHLIRTLRIAEITTRNAIHCKLVNCDGWCICEDGVNEFKCPKCESVNCVSCQVSHILNDLFASLKNSAEWIWSVHILQAIHTGRNCKEHQDEIKYDTADDTKRTKLCLDDIVANNLGLKCPKCQVCWLIYLVECDFYSIENNFLLLHRL